MSDIGSLVTDSTDSSISLSKTINLISPNLSTSFSLSFLTLADSILVDEVDSMLDIVDAGSSCKEDTLEDADDSWYDCLLVDEEKSW